MLVKLATKLESDKKLVDVLKRSGKDLELTTLFSYLQTSSIGSALEVGGFNCQFGVV